MTLDEFEAGQVRMALCASTPVPDSPKVCGLPAAVSVIVTVPLAAPATVGLKTIPIVHDAPAATVPPFVQTLPD